jgi:spore maturation protein CgeB
LEVAPKWDLGYLATYSDDRQPTVDALLVEPARRWPQGRFNVTGPKYPESIEWPSNVDRETHLAPRDHPAFYSAQRFTLNVTRDAMKVAGYSPSVRLFEAGACACPVISDWWPGLDEFFRIGSEVLVAESAEDVLRFLHDTPERLIRSMGAAARERVLALHTPAARALEIEEYLKEMNDNFFSHSARRDGCGGEKALRVAAGMAFEQDRPGAGGTVSTEAGSLPDDGNL